MTPEQRAEMRARMQNMSPEERAQMRGRFGGGEGGVRAQNSRATAPAVGNARSVEPPRPVFRPVWLLKNGKLERVMLRIGINDGAMTAVLDGPIQEGAAVVTGVAQPQSAQQGGNPMLGRFPGGPGGFGGGFGGGRGGAGGNRRGPGGG
jgi:hypothetical protein